MSQVKNTSFAESFVEEWVKIFAGIESYDSPYAQTVGDPTEILESIVREAAWKSASISAFSALPPGPFGYLTILPELAILFRIQGHLIKDIASLYGKETLLNQELMLYCLFQKHKAEVFQSVVEESTLKIIIRPSSIRILETLLPQVGKSLTINRSSRWIPLLGAAISGSFSYWETLEIGKNTIRIFSKEIHHLSDEEVPE
jgi:hypothetical protein